MASLDTTPVRELTDSELRRRLLALGFDVPVSVNREFLVRKLENASAGGGQGGKASKRHSIAVTNNSDGGGGGRGSPSAIRKRKSVAATTHSSSSSNSNAGGLHNSVSSRGHHLNSTPMMSPLASSSPLPSQFSSGSPTMSNIGTPSTPSPQVSRWNTPLNNGDNSHSPRYMNYYNYFKTTGGGDGNGSSRQDDGYGYGRSIRTSAGISPVTSVSPPTRSSDRYAGAKSGTGSGGEPGWVGGHLVSKILLGGFILFFIVIGGLYLRQIMGSNDPRGLAGSSSVDGGVKEAPPPPPPPPVKKAAPTIPPMTSMVYPICGLKGVDPNACIPKEVVKNSRTLFNVLKEELAQRARSKGCRPDIQDRVSLQEAKTILYKLTELRKTDVDAAFQGMLLLVSENPRGGLSLDSSTFSGEEITSKDVQTLDMALTKIAATDVQSDFVCGVVAFLTSVALYLTIAAAGTALVFLGWKLFCMYRSRKKSEEEEIFKIVDQILELLYQQYELSENSQGTAYLAVNHIRDELVPPQERLKKEALWNRVVDYISNHESRVREEIQHISGEEFRVWRWLPTASPLASKRFSTANHRSSSTSRLPMPMRPSSPPVSPNAPMSSNPAAGPSATMSSVAGPSLSSPKNNLYPTLSDLNTLDDDDSGCGALADGGDKNSNKWQGQAFEICEGGPNALPTTPTTCLKIRHMLTDRDGTITEQRSRIEQTILEKCKNARILHIGIDPTSVEGCVYVRCLTKDDARAVFLALHGWWFDGHLLSVKFLREERYLNRFQESRNCTVPLGRAH